MEFYFVPLVNWYFSPDDPYPKIAVLTDTRFWTAFVLQTFSIACISYSSSAETKYEANLKKCKFEVRALLPELHDKPNDLPFLCERKTVNKVTKLMCTLENKTQYHAYFSEKLF